MSYVEGNGNPFTMNVVPAGTGMGMMGGLGGFGCNNNYGCGY